MSNKASCCSFPALILPKAGPCQPIPPCSPCAGDPCRCAPPCPPPCPPRETPPRCPVCGFSPCRCEQARGACRAGRFLIPRVLGSGSCRERQVCERLCVERLPRAAVPPYTLQSVSVSPEPPWWEEQPCERRGTISLLVSVPLNCVIRDARGDCFQAPATLSKRVCVRLSCPSADSWRFKIVIQACARLLNCPQSCRDGCFDALLETQLDAYATALCVAGRPDAPDCPFDDRPLFPQPCRPWR